MPDPLNPATEEPAPRRVVVARRHGPTAPADTDEERCCTSEQPAVNPAPGASVDRYVVTRRLGASRHADIYAAHDPELDRTVVLKLLSLETVDAADGYRRLMAEAQATARLADPNIVKVHDVGTWRGRPYLAREFVEGASVATWKKRVGPSRAEVLRVMIEAGKGLAALHAAGLVHRDLSLHAILVGGDGSVRVTDMDFVGSVDLLAVRSARDGDTFDSLEQSAESPSQESTGCFVRAAGLSGTFGDSPYASPEQLLGRVADARSDQFSYCVALYEALYDKPPFGHGTALRRLSRIERGQLASPPGRYSRRLFKALRRGLSAEPNERFVSMNALLRAITQRGGKLTWLAPGAAAVVGFGVVVAVTSPERASYCGSVEAKLHGIWSKQRAAQLRASFASTNLSYAPDVAEFVAAELDAWATRWNAREVELCEQQASGDALVAKTRERHCLSQRREALESVVDALVIGDARTVESAVQIVGELPSVESCATASSWATTVTESDEANEIYGGLLRVGTLIGGKRAAEALPLSEALVGRARAYGDGSLRVRAQTQRAILLEMLEMPEAEAALHEALSDALATAQYGSVVDIAQTLASLRVRERRFEQAERWLAHAEAAIDHAADSADEPGLASIQSQRARICTLRGDFEGALAGYRRAHAIRAEQLGGADVRVAGYRVNLGQAYQDLGRYNEARAEYEAALRTMQNALGPAHPDLARTHMALGTVLATQGDNARAMIHGGAALHILEQAYGDTRTVVADALMSAAVAYSATGNIGASMKMQERALKIYVKTVGPRSYRVALVINNMGVLNFNNGNYAESERYYRESIDIISEALGADHVQTARIQNSLIPALFAQGKYEEAKEFLATVETTIQAKVTTDIPMVAYWLSYSAELDAIEGRFDEALPKLERAVKIHGASVADGPEQGQVNLMIAVVRRHMGQVAQADAIHAATVTQLRSSRLEGAATAITEAGRFRKRVEDAKARRALSE